MPASTLPGRRREGLVAHVLLAPALLPVLGVLACPVAWGAWISLTSFAARAERPGFVGLANDRAASRSGTAGTSRASA